MSYAYISPIRSRCGHVLERVAANFADLTINDRPDYAQALKGHTSRIRTTQKVCVGVKKGEQGGGQGHTSITKALHKTSSKDQFKSASEKKTLRRSCRAFLFRIPWNLVSFQFVCATSDWIFWEMTFQDVAGSDQSKHIFLGVCLIGFLLALVLIYGGPRHSLGQILQRKWVTTLSTGRPLEHTFTCVRRPPSVPTAFPFHGRRYL